MNSMMKILAAAKLIELEDDETLAQPEDSATENLSEYDAGYEGTDSMPSDAVDADTYAPTTDVSQQADAGMNDGTVEAVVERKEFQQIYADANVVTSPYPAERLIRLLEGLQAMDAPTRNAAVQAMDAADDTWSIADPISDAEKKSASLQAYARALQAQNAAYEQQLNNDIQLLKSEQAETVASIRKQIEELEALQQRQIEKTQTAVAEKQAAISQQHERVALEVARIETEASKLNQVAQQFAHLLSGA